MEKLFDAVNENCTMYDAIYNSMKMQREKDLTFVKSTYEGGLSEEKIDQIEHDYSLNMDKLDFIPELTCREETLQRKFTQMALYVDYLDIDMGRKLDTILTFGALISTVPTHLEFLDNEKCYLMSTAMSSLPINLYPSYGLVISNEGLLDSIMKKSNDMNERRKMIYNMFDYFDERVYDEMTNDEYEQVVSDCVEMANNFEVKNVEKISSK